MIPRHFFFSLCAESAVRVERVGEGSLEFETALPQHDNRLQMRSLTELLCSATLFLPASEGEAGDVS